MLRFKATKGFGIEKSLEEFTLSEGFQRVKGQYCFSKDFKKAFSHAETYPDYCKELINYKIVPVEFLDYDKLSDIKETMEFFRDNFEEEAIGKECTGEVILSEVELRILVFVAVFVKKQGYEGNEIKDIFKDFSKFSVKRNKLENVFNQEEKEMVQEVQNWGSFVFAYNALFDGSFQDDFSASG